MKYKVVPTKKFKKEYNLAIKRGKKIEKLHNIVELLVKDLDLPASLCDYELKGNWKNHRELHIEGDWLLIYQKIEDVLILELTRTVPMQICFNFLVNLFMANYLHKTKALVKKKRTSLKLVLFYKCEGVVLLHLES